jgi:hypothetical protein
MHNPIYIIGFVFIMLFHSSCGTLYYSYEKLTKKYDSTLKWKARKAKDNPKPQVLGKVIDKPGYEIPFVHIILSNKTRTYCALSDVKGYFSFPDTIQLGAYRVTCGYIGFETLVYDSLYIKPCKKIELTIKLAEVVLSGPI